MAQMDGKQLKSASVNLGTKGVAASFTDALVAAGIIGDSKLTQLPIRADGTRAATADIPWGGFKLTGLGTPTAGTDAATKAYADSLANGLDLKASSRLATVAALPSCTSSGAGVGKTLTADAFGALSVDGVAVANSDRVLVKNQVAAKDNGIYSVTVKGDAGTQFVLTRATDADQDAEVTAGMFTFIAEGTVNADYGFILTTNDPIVVDTTSLSFSAFSHAGVLTADEMTLTIVANVISIKAGGVGTTELAALGVTSTKLAAASVTAGKIAAGGISASDQFAAGVVDSAALAAGAVTAGKIGAGGVSASNQFAAGVVDATAIAAAVAGDGLTGAAGSPIAVGATDSSIVVAANGIAAAVPANLNKAVAADVTVADFDEACATAITSTPSGDGYVRVDINGIGAEVGDGVRTKDCYFSADAGATARTIAAITAGDKLYWVGSVAGFQLAATDKVDFSYNYHA